MRRIIASILICFPLLTAGQGRASLGFWNVENLYDTIPSLFYDDTDYTPHGRLRWGAERYGNKLRNLSQVLDEMALDVAGLAEVESEQAVRDLVATLKTDYNFIHRVSGDRRGMDMALLYKGDKFVPERVGMVKSSSPREFLYVRGELMGRRIDIVVCHLPSQFNSRAYREKSLAALYGFADSLQKADGGARIVIMGDFNTAPSDPAMKRAFHTRKDLFDGEKLIFSPLAKHAAQGKGSYAYKDRWRLFDNIFLSVKFLSGESVRYTDCGIFIRPYMIASDVKNRRGYPLRTFSAGQYLDGYSDHLPIYVILELTR